MTLSTVAMCWRNHKSRLKKKYFLRIGNRVRAPKNVIPKDYEALVEYWNLPKMKVLFYINMLNYYTLICLIIDHTFKYLLWKVYSNNTLFKYVIFFIVGSSFEEQEQSFQAKNIYILLVQKAMLRTLKKW